MRRFLGLLIALFFSSNLKGFVKELALIHCRSFFQMVAIFALSILWPVNPAMAQSPSCSGALISPISEAHVRSTLDQIAELKLEVDLAHAQGDTSTLLRLLDYEYDKTIQTLSNRLKSKFSDAELHDLIAARIKTLQKEKNPELKAETQARAAEHVLAKAYHFTRKIDTNTDGLVTSLTYLDARDTVIFTDSKSRKLLMLDLSSDHITALQKDVLKYFVLNNQNSLLTLSSKGQLSLLDLQSKDIKPATSIPVQTHNLQDLTPSGRIFATADNINNQLMLIDLDTGALHNTKIKLPEPLKGISALKFINDQEILLSRFMEQFFYRININTGHIEVIEAGAQTVEGIQVSPDREHLIFHTKKEGLVHIKAAELSDLKNRTGHSIGKSAMNLSYMPDGVLLFVVYREDTLKRGIFSSEVIQHPLFNFPESMNAMDPQIITLPAIDGKEHRFFFPSVSKDADGIKQFHIEVWQREP